MMVGGGYQDDAVEYDEEGNVKTGKPNKVENIRCYVNYFFKSISFYSAASDQATQARNVCLILTSARSSSRVKTRQMQILKKTTIVLIRSLKTTIEGTKSTSQKISTNTSFNNSVRQKNLTNPPLTGSHRVYLPNAQTHY